MAKVKPIEKRVVAERLDQLRGLEKGWLDGQGEAIPEEGIDWLIETMSECYPSDLGKPLMTPTEEGGIRLEWDFDGPDAAEQDDPKPVAFAMLDIDLVEHHGLFLSCAGSCTSGDCGKKQCLERKLHLDETIDWAKLILMLHELRRYALDGTWDDRT